MSLELVFKLNASGIFMISSKNTDLTYISLNSQIYASVETGSSGSTSFTIHILSFSIKTNYFGSSSDHFISQISLFSNCNYVKP